MLIDRSAIARLIPHQGGMSVLDAVEAFDDRSIVCVSDRHREPAHPLRRNACLSALHACEFAAQAVALHGAVTAHMAGAPAPSQGYLAALTDVSLHTETLDEQLGELRIRAERLLGESASFIYSFDVRVGAMSVADGRVTVVSGRT